MKHFKQILLTVLVALTSSMTASAAYDFEVDGIYYNYISQEDLTCQVTYKTSYNSYSGEVTIPSSVEYNSTTFSVTSIGNWAFKNCSSLTSVEIPNSVTTIGENAFYGCSNLTSFIGKFASEDHRCLIVDGVLNSFAPAGLTSYEILGSVTSIGRAAFHGCSSLTSVEIPNSVTEIGHYAFAECSNLTSVVIPNSVTTIGENAFSGCSNLTSVTIPNSVTSIGGSAFYWCKISKATFGCSSDIAKLIPYTVMEEITLSENVQKFTTYPFNECGLLLKVTSLSKVPPTLIRTQFTNFQFEDMDVVVPEDALDEYKTAKVWKEFAYLQGDDIETIEGDPVEMPVISIVDGKLHVSTCVENAKCRYSITSSDFTDNSVCGNEAIELTGQYIVNACVTIDGKRKSETATATLVWVNPTIEGSDVMSMEAKKAVLIRTQDGNIIVSGTERGEGIQLYSIDGQMISSMSADDEETIIPCNAGKGEVIIVKYGGKAVKVMM